MNVSKHARQRVKERCGCGKSSSDRMAALAFERGTPRNNTSGSLRKWLDGYYFSQTFKMDIRVFGDKAYIFGKRNGEKILITVLQIPSNITKNMKNMMHSKAKGTQREPTR